MNVLRKISIDTVLLALAVLCLAALVWLRDASAWFAAVIVGVALATKAARMLRKGGGPMSASNAPPACPTCGGAGTIESDEPFMMMSALPLEETPIAEHCDTCGRELRQGVDCCSPPVKKPKKRRAKKKA